MPRTKGNIESYFFAYQKYVEGMSQNQILEALINQEKDNYISLRTIGNWLKEFRVCSGCTKESRTFKGSEVCEHREKTHAEDHPFEWNKCEQYGIPWSESQGILRKVSEWKSKKGQIPPARMAKWWWRISQTGDWANHEEELFSLGERYVKCEWKAIFEIGLGTRNELSELDEEVIQTISTNNLFERHSAK